MLLDSLNIQGYRALRSLRLDRLGRVNLFVGRNNTGKSSLLEAVRIFATRGAPSLLWNILRDRDEISSRAETNMEQLMEGVGSLFHGRDGTWDSRPPIAIGPVGNNHFTLRLALTWLGSAASDVGATAANIDLPRGVPLPVLDVAFAGKSEHRPLEQMGKLARLGLPRDGMAVEHVPVEGVSAPHMARLWDSVALTPTEDMVTRALRFVSPDIERISILGRPRQVVVAKIAGYERPVPLGSLGDGVNRVLGIALSLANARNGIASFDEIENGLHYSVMRQLWSVVFATAHELDVQVFAVTHSWDCIAAFQRAAAEDPHEQALLVRLDRERDGQIRPTLVSERDLSILTREHIEVR